jgi:hypothetical protein
MNNLQKIQKVRVYARKLGFRTKSDVCQGLHTLSESVWELETKIDKLSLGEQVTLKSEVEEKLNANLENISKHLGTNLTDILLPMKKPRRMIQI